MPRAMHSRRLLSRSAARSPGRRLRRGFSTITRRVAASSCCASRSTTNQKALEDPLASSSLSAGDRSALLDLAGQLGRVGSESPACAADQVLGQPNRDRRPASKGPVRRHRHALEGARAGREQQARSPRSRRRVRRGRRGTPGEAEGLPGGARQFKLGTTPWRSRRCRASW